MRAVVSVSSCLVSTPPLTWRCRRQGRTWVEYAGNAVWCWRGQMKPIFFMRVKAAASANDQGTTGRKRGRWVRTEARGGQLGMLVRRRQRTSFASSWLVNERPPASVANSFTSSAANNALLAMKPNAIWLMASASVGGEAENSFGNSGGGASSSLALWLGGAVCTARKCQHGSVRICLAWRRCPQPSRSTDRSAAIANTYGLLTVRRGMVCHCCGVGFKDSE